MTRQLQIVRHAFRRLRGKPLYTTVIVLCLALGIGANSAIFSIVNTLLLNPLLVRDMDRLVFTLDMRNGDDPFEAAGVVYVALKNEAKSLSSVGVGRLASFRLAGRERPEQVEGAAISAEYFSTLGISPAIGRTFIADDDRPGAGSVTILSYQLWQDRFGKDKGILGQTVRLDNRSYMVIGVMPKGFDLPLGTSLWVPIATNFETLPVPERTAHYLFIIGRLRSGVSLEQANTEARNLSIRLEQEFPTRRSGWIINLIPLRQQVLGDITGHIRPAVYFLVFVVGFLLLIACANVANLLLVRSLERNHEVAVQIALGASRRRLIAQLLTESVMLSLAGGIAGLALARFVAFLFAVFKPISTFSLKDSLEHVQMDGHVLLFTFLIALGSGILFGLAPMLQVVFPEGLSQGLRQGGQRANRGLGGRRLLDVLMVLEIVMAVVLLTGAGFMISNFQQLRNVTLGFRADHLMALQMYLSAEDYPQYRQRADFVNRLVERVKDAPGVLSAGVTTNIPLSTPSEDTSYTVEGKPFTDSSDVTIAADRVVTPGYLEMMNVRLLRGRLLTDQDRPDTLPVVVVSRDFARRSWPGEDPIGKRVKRGSPPREDSPWYSVVGLVDDVKEDRFNYRVDRPVWYMSYAQRDLNIPIFLVVLSDKDPSSLVSSVRNVILSINKDQSISNVVTIEEHISQFLAPQRFSALAGTIFALIGLVLAIVGIYSVTSYSVTQRTREFGIRIALGAQRGDLIRIILRDGLRLAAIGMGIGLLGGIFMGRVISRLLYQVSPTSPATLAGTLFVLLLVTLAAMYVPTRRVLKVNPSSTLRYE